MSEQTAAPSWMAFGGGSFENEALFGALMKKAHSCREGSESGCVSRLDIGGFL